MSANKTIPIVLAIAGVLGLWEAWSHLVLTGWPPQMLHWLAGSIGFSIALLLGTVAARGMWSDYLGRRQATRRLESVQRVLDRQVLPLVTAAIGPLSSAATGASGQISGSARETIEFARDAVRDTLPPLEAINDIRRLELGIHPLNLSRCKVNALVGEVEDEVRANAPLRRVGFYVTPSLDPTEALIDRERVKRALREMITAATKVTRRGGVIRMDARWRADAKKLSITIDAGVGPGASELDLAEFPDSESVGLTFCSVVARAHGGSFSISSPGKGRVRMTLHLRCERQKPLRKERLAYRQASSHS